MWKDVRWAVAITLIAALLVIVYGLYQTPKYEATAKVLALQKPPPSDCYQGICPIPNAPEDDTPFTAAVAKAMPTKPVARAVAKQLRLPRGSALKVLKNTNADVDAGTAFIDVTYTDSSPKRAQQITNTLATVSSERITETSPAKLAKRSLPHRITATLWQPARLPATPVSPNPIRNGVITLAIGLALSLVVVEIRVYRGRYTQ